MFDASNDVFNDDSFARNLAVKFAVIGRHFLFIGPPVWDCDDGTGLFVSSKSTVSKNCGAGGELPVFPVDALFIMPTAWAGLTEKNNSSARCGDDVFDHAAFFRP